MARNEINTMMSTSEMVVTLLLQPVHAIGRAVARAAEAVRRAFAGAVERHL